MAEPQFNLIDSRWIPVVKTDGKRDEMSIEAVLAQAENISAIEHSSPLVTIAIHRLLLAILYRAFNGPTSDDDALKLWDDWRQSDIDAYLLKWKDHFWLMHNDCPFWQNARFTAESEKKGGKPGSPWTRLVAEFNGTSTGVLFDHTALAPEKDMPYSQAAGYLAAAQTFAFATKLKLGEKKGSVGDSPSMSSTMVLVFGKNLRETLLFNLAPYDETTDAPFWEKKPPSEKSTLVIKKVPVGFVDILTWQSRTINLHSGADGVARVSIGAGTTISEKDGAKIPFEDPFCPRFEKITKDKKGQITKREIVPIGIDADKGLWRDFASLLPEKKKTYAAATVQNSYQISRDKGNFPRAMLVIGLVKSKAGIKLWCREQFVLPTSLRESERGWRGDIKELLECSEYFSKKLNSAVKKFLSELADMIGGNKSASLDKKKSIKDKHTPLEYMVQNASALPIYWSHLETCFHRDVLAEYGAADANDAENLFRKIKLKWLKDIKAALTQAWNTLTRSVGDDVWTLRALSCADGVIGAAHSKLKDKIEAIENELKPKETV